MIGVLGASGFIGRTLIDSLVADGLSVRAYTRGGDLYHGEGVQHASHHMGQAVDPARFDGIETLVLAVSATRPNTPGNSLQGEIERNVVPYVRLIEGLRETGIRRLIYLSSGGAIYGDRPDPTPIHEDSHRTPSEPYGFGKLCIEGAIAAGWRGAGRSHTVIRPANPVGRHQLSSVGAHGLVGTVLHHLREGLPITIQGDGSAVRDYFAASDLADLIVRTATAPAQDTVVNAGSGRGLSVLEVIEHCAAYLGVVPDLRLNADDRPSVRFNVLCNSRAEAIFGWRPHTSITDVLAELNAGLDRHAKAPSAREGRAAL